MKRLFLIIAFVAGIGSAQAWTKLVNDASLMLAKKYMTPAATAEYNRIAALKGSVDYKWAASQDVTVALDADLRSTSTDERDIVVRIERAAELLRNRAKHSDKEVYTALQEILMLMPELHNISRIHIEGIANSQRDFTITWIAGKPGSKRFEKRGTISWSTFWTRLFCGWHQAWTPEYYAYDLDIHFAAEREQWMQGTPRDWAHDMGMRAKPMYEWAEQDYVMHNAQRLNLEEVHLGSVARAGFRIATLLNNALR